MNNFILLKVDWWWWSVYQIGILMIYCGGGGGYIGGKACIPKHNLNFNFDYVAGSGGSSFIQQINFKSDYISYLDNYFINDYNDSDGC